MKMKKSWKMIRWVGGDIRLSCREMDGREQEDPVATRSAIIRSQSFSSETKMMNDLVPLPPAQEQQQRSDQEHRASQKHEDHVGLRLPAVTQDAVLDLLLVGVVLVGDPVVRLFADLHGAAVEPVVVRQLAVVVVVVGDFAAYALEFDGEVLCHLLASVLAHLCPILIP